MKIGLIDADSHNFPNLALMKISAWHKQNGDEVEWAFPMTYYDKVYFSKVFGEEYSKMPEIVHYINAKEVVYGGTGLAISIENGKEVYSKEKDIDLPKEIEHIYPDYLLYPELTQNTAFGFLTRGCPNNCSFCLVSPKEGRCSRKVTDLSEFWKGQKYIKLLDPNLLASKDSEELLQQLIDSNASVDFVQGLDARFINEKKAILLSKIKTKTVHFAFDFLHNEKAIIKGLKLYKEICGLKYDVCSRTVYVLTNYDTTHEEDMHRIDLIEQCGYAPYVMVYRKKTAPQITKDLQRWANNRRIYKTCKFADYRR